MTTETPQEHRQIPDGLGIGYVLTSAGLADTHVAVALTYARAAAKNDTPDGRYTVAAGFLRAAQRLLRGEEL